MLALFGIFGYHWLKIAQRFLGGDFSKALNTIDHDFHIAKLQSYDFDNNGLKLLFSYLGNRWHGENVNQKFSS